jgi:hypothetical protein
MFNPRKQDINFESISLDLDMFMGTMEKYVVNYLREHGIPVEQDGFGDYFLPKHYRKQVEALLQQLFSEQ